MKIISLNVNGLRAFYNRGDGDGSLLQDLLDQHNPDILLFQETKCSDEDFEWWLGEWKDHYDLISNQNLNKAGYAGVGAMIRKGLNPKVSRPIMTSSEYDTGRIIELELSEMYIIGVYVLNSGDKDELREEWNNEFKEYLATLPKPYIILGDMNVCSRPEDCWAYEEYFDEVPGVKEYEIEHFNKMLKDYHLHDAWLDLHPSTSETYSWFSYRGASRYKNQGFRLDYALVDDLLWNKVIDCEILGSPCEYSDHNPILLNMK